MDVTNSKKKNYNIEVTLKEDLCMGPVHFIDWLIKENQKLFTKGNG